MKNKLNYLEENPLQISSNNHNKIHYNHSSSNSLNNNIILNTKNLYNTYNNISNTNHHKNKTNNFSNNILRNNLTNNNYINSLLTPKENKVNTEQNQITEIHIFSPTEENIKIKKLNLHNSNLQNNFHNPPDYPTSANNKPNLHNLIREPDSYNSNLSNNVNLFFYSNYFKNDLNLSKGLLNSSINQAGNKFYTPIAQIDLNKKKVNIFFLFRIIFRK